MQKSEPTQFSREVELLDAAEAAYLLARSEVYNKGLHEGDAGLTPHQQAYLQALKAAEEALETHRRQNSPAGSPQQERKP